MSRVDRDPRQYPVTFLGRNLMTVAVSGPSPFFVSGSKMWAGSSGGSALKRRDATVGSDLPPLPDFSSLAVC